MITWVEFESTCKDRRMSFENMCRLLFKKHFCNKDTILHSNPNNPGVEVDPIIGKDGKRISFQAKYFDANTDYRNIKESCEKTKNHYEGKIDAVYLYCNKDLDCHSASYQECVSIIESIGAELIPITNQEILEQAQVDKEIIAGYFSGIVFDNEWFETKKETAIRQMGSRYNREFNVETEAEKRLTAFTCCRRTCEMYEETLNDLLKSIHDYHGLWERGFKDRIREMILGFKANHPEHIQEYQCFSTALISACTPEINSIKDQISKTWEEIRGGDWDKNQLRTDYYYLNKLYQCLNGTVAKLIELDNLSNARMAVVNGESGAGKSQLFAHLVDIQNADGQQRLLISGDRFVGNEQISVQFSHTILARQIDMSVLFDAFECIAQQNDNTTVLFIDAVNESPNWTIWDSGLVQILELLETHPNVKIAISVRSNAQKLIFRSAEKYPNQIAHIVDQGFTQSDAQNYCKHYGVPVLPTDLLNEWMGNPLMLSLYCKLDDHTNKNRIDIFEKAIELWDDESKTAIGIRTTANLLRCFLNDYLDLVILNRDSIIKREELFGLAFWEKYSIKDTWGYASSLESLGLLASNESHYFLTFNMMQDYLVAKRLVDRCNSIEDVQAAVFDLLEIKEGRVSVRGYSFLSIVPYLSILCYRKYNQEIIRTIIGSIQNQYEKEQIIDEYVESYEWRTPADFDVAKFIEFLNEYGIHNEEVYNVLLSSSIKKQHPLNARYLNARLQKMSMANRDAVWTRFINDIPLSDSPWLLSIIEIFTDEKNIVAYDDQQLMLTLNLFGWVLTSSNRYLRDNCSKAMVVILSNRLNLCLPLMRLFADVNDPYVSQRIMGVVLGAVLRRKEEWTDEFRSIAEYVYHEVFEQDEVYPDVLYREYARLIIERWIYENPSQSVFDKEVFCPPYNSADIPKIDRPEIVDKHGWNGGIGQIIASMRTTHYGAGMYGDFGRYIFEYALQGFEGVDVLNASYYAIDYIVRTLGYSDTLFKNDTHPFDREPRSSKRGERIGKKYQWIALYNTVAKVADNHKRTDDFWGNDSWNLSLRDFDPTLSNDEAFIPGVPEFEKPFVSEEAFIQYDCNQSEEGIAGWIDTRSKAFDLSVNKLIYTDKNKEEWVVLGQYQTLNSEQHPDPISYGGPEVWRHAFAYFIPTNSWGAIFGAFANTTFMGNWFPQAHDIDDLYIREYYWSSEFEKEEFAGWMDVEVDTGEVIETEIELTDNMKELYKILRQVEGENNDIPFEDEGDARIIREPKKKVIARVLPSFIDAGWNHEYDASKNNSFNLSIPCKELSDYLQLIQREDGVFFTGNELVAFDSKLVGLGLGLLFKKKYLDQFMKAKCYKLFWTVYGEQQVVTKEYQYRSEWSGLVWLKKDDVQGEIDRYSNDQFKNRMHFIQ